MLSRRQNNIVGPATRGTGFPLRRLFIAAFLSAGLFACELADPNASYPRGDRATRNPNPAGETNTVFGPGGLNLFGSSGEAVSGGGAGIGINTFLWRASLDTLSFMPLISADPFGGVIITDWYSPPETPQERFKMNIYILDRQLRADGIKVAVFRQSRQTDSEWVSQTVAPETVTKLEDAILVRARQLRVATLE